jgi:hypothetical protein
MQGLYMAEFMGFASQSIFRQSGHRSAVENAIKSRIYPEKGVTSLAIFRQVNPHPPW